MEVSKSISQKVNNLLNNSGKTYNYNNHFNKYNDLVLTDSSMLPELGNILVDCSCDEIRNRMSSFFYIARCFYFLIQF